MCSQKSQRKSHFLFMMFKDTRHSDQRHSMQKSFFLINKYLQVLSFSIPRVNTGTLFFCACLTVFCHASFWEKATWHLSFMKSGRLRVLYKYAPRKDLRDAYLRCVMLMSRYCVCCNTTRCHSSRNKRVQKVNKYLA